MHRNSPPGPGCNPCQINVFLFGIPEPKHMSCHPGGQKIASYKNGSCEVHEKTAPVFFVAYFRGPHPTQLYLGNIS